MPSPAANPACWRMLTAWSGAWWSRPSRSCRSAPRPMVIPSAAALRVAVIWDANLGLRPHAAQEFRLVDDRDVDQLAVLGLGKEPGHRGGDGFADAANLIDLVGRSPGERLHGPEVAGE